MYQFIAYVSTENRKYSLKEIYRKKDVNARHGQHTLYADIQI